MEDIKNREPLIKIPGSSVLLKKLCETEDEKALEHIYLVFKGIQWTEEEIDILSSNDVISTVFQCGLNINKEESILIIIRIAQILLKIKKIPEINIISSKAPVLSQNSNVISQEIQSILSVSKNSKGKKQLRK